MRSPGDAVAGLRQARQRAAHAAARAGSTVLPARAVLEKQLRGDRGAQAELALHLARAEARACRARPGSRARRRRRRSATLAQTSATSATSPLVIQRLVPFRRSRPATGRARVSMPAGIRAEIGLGQAEAADRLAARQARQPVPLLRLRAEGVDRIHHQARLHADERAQAGVAALELLVDQPVGDVVQPGAAVLCRQVGAEEAQLGDARGQLDRKGPVAEVLGDDRQVLVLDEVPGRVAHQALLWIEQLLDLVVVGALKRGSLLDIVALRSAPPLKTAPDRAPPTKCRLLRC